MIGEALRLLRIFYGLKATEISKSTGLSQSYISEIENGHKQPSLEALEKYALTFEMKLSTLMLFAESIENDKVNKKDIKAKQYVARSGMKLLAILDKVGNLDDE